MEFDKAKVYTALNSDDLHAGDKVVLADSLLRLKKNISLDRIEVLENVLNESYLYRFSKGMNNFNLAYLVERKKEQKYIPWTVETCPLKCGDVVIRTSGNKHIEFLIQGIDKSEEVTYGTRVQLNDDWTTF